MARAGSVEGSPAGSRGRSAAPARGPSEEPALPARRIDLHAHSTASDGTTLPADLVREAAGAGLDVVALTDHDTTAGWAEAVAALPEGLALVRGAELSCVADGVSLHLLAYLFDPAEPRLARAREEMRESRVTRAQRMVASLEAAGTGVTWEQVQALAAGSVGRPHVAQALVERGLVASIPDAFTPQWIGAGGRHWAGKLELDVREAVRMVAAAGGVSVFAHPAASARGRTVPDSLYAELAEAGLAGLEVDHPDQDEAARAALRRHCRELGLVATGSSDFHGAHKQVRLGEQTTAEDAYEALVAGASGSAVVAA